MILHVDSADRKNGTAESFDIDFQGISKREGVLAIRNVQIPYSWYNIRTKVNTFFRVTFSNASAKNIYLSNSTDFQGNPTSGSAIAYILSQININTAGDIFTVVINQNSGKILFTETQGRAFTLDFVNCDKFTYKILGFLSGIYTSVASKIESAYCVNFTPERFIFIKSSITTRPGDKEFDSNNGTSSTLVKVPVAGAGITVFGNILHEPNFPSIKHVKLDNTIKFEIFHDDHTPLDLNGLDWSMSLLYE